MVGCITIWVVYDPSVANPHGILEIKVVMHLSKSVFLKVQLFSLSCEYQIQVEAESQLLLPSPRTDIVNHTTLLFEA